MNLKDTTLRGISQVLKDKCHMISLICGSKKVKFTEAKNSMVIPFQGLGSERIQEKLVKR